MTNTKEGAIVDALFDALFDALSRSDVAAAERCLAPDARVWHSFDQVAQDRDCVTCFPEIMPLVS